MHEQEGNSTSTRHSNTSVVAPLRKWLQTGTFGIEEWGERPYELAINTHLVKSLITTSHARVARTFALSSSRAKGSVCTAHAQPFAASCAKSDVDKSKEKKKGKKEKRKRESDPIVLEARDDPVVVVDPSTLRSRDALVRD